MIRALLNGVPKDQRLELADELEISYDNLCRKLQSNYYFEKPREFKKIEKTMIRIWMKSQFDLDVPENVQTMPLFELVRAAIENIQNLEEYESKN